MMPPRRRTLRIFVSFEFGKDNDLKSSFFGQAKVNTPHRVRNFSLKEAYPDHKWVEEARSAIKECDVVIVLIGKDTHNAPGVKTEVGIARSMNKPIFQVRLQKWAYAGVRGLEEPSPWEWKGINEKLDEIRS